MKKIFCLTFILLFSINVYSQTGWVPQISGTNQTLFSVFFTDSQTGWTVGYSGIILKTTNSGISWNIQYNSGYQILGSIYFLNPQTGWAAGIHAGQSRVLRTTNAGANWIESVFGGWVLMNIQFIDGNTGWASGSRWYNSEATVLKTTNGGINWTVQYDSIGSGINSIYNLYIVNQNIGWAVGWANAVLKTTNGGLNWLLGSLYNVYGVFQAVTFLNQNTGFLGGSDIYSTTNGGINWTQYGMNYNIRSFKIVDQNISYGAGGLGNIIRTSNNGLNWSLQTSGTTRALNSIFFVDQNIGWVVGDSGTILKTTTGGLTFIEKTSSILPTTFSLYQNYPNPFNPSTTIKFEIPKSSSVQLTIYDVLGKEITKLINEELKPGIYSVDWTAGNYPSGVYFYKLQSGNFVETKKIILIK